MYNSGMRKRLANEKAAEKKSLEKYKEASRLFKSKSYKAAAEAFTEAINIRPLPKFHFYRGNCYKHLHDYDR
jgi:TolA-binding protein